MRRSPTQTSLSCWQRSAATTRSSSSPHLNYDLIRANPNVFQGYSDVIVLHYRAEDPQLHRHPHARWSRHESTPRPAP